MDIFGSMIYSAPPAINSILSLGYTILIVICTLEKNEKGILAWLILTSIQIVLEIVYKLFLAYSYKAWLYGTIKKWLYAISILSFISRVAAIVPSALLYSKM